MNRFPGPFLPRSTARALFVPWLRHARWFMRSPAYRAWLRFNRQLGGRPRHAPGVVNYRGRPLRYLDAASFLSAWHDIFVAELYRLPAGPRSAAPLLIDAGANIGLAPLYWSTQFPAFEYIGFEPDPGAAAVCRENLHGWGCPGIVHQTAVAIAAGRRSFIRDFADAGHLMAAGASPDTIEVSTEPLSRFITRPVDLLKIDIEGAEDEVLQEVEPKLPLVRNLFVELHSRRGEPQRWGAIVDRLQRSGFRCYVRPVLPAWRPFDEPSPGGPEFDEQINLFAVRIDATGDASSAT